METTQQVEVSARVAADGADDMRDVRVSLRPTREPGKLVVHVTISHTSLAHVDLEVDDVTHDFELLDGNVLVLRFELVPAEKQPAPRLSRPYSERWRRIQVRRPNARP